MDELMKVVSPRWDWSLYKERKRRRAPILHQVRAQREVTICKPGRKSPLETKV